VGALSIDNLHHLQLLSRQEFSDTFDIDISLPFILITVHPETVSYEANTLHIQELVTALQEVKNFNLLITMPNADTMGNMIRKKLWEFAETAGNVKCVESLGTIGYLTAMKYCSFMLGNTSSGFVEASFFPRYVINLGDRQKGRILGRNIINCTFERSAIIKAIELVEEAPALTPDHLYGKGNTAGKIIEILKKL
jgi:GDP/UDP-N,N'-diacetylbacillosamine 2-epimerase (hydrolysing)